MMGFGISLSNLDFVEFQAVQKPKFYPRLQGPSPPLSVPSLLKAFSKLMKRVSSHHSWKLVSDKTLSEPIFVLWVIELPFDPWRFRV